MGTMIHGLNNLEHVSVKIRRLFAIACYDYVKPHLSNFLGHVIEFARHHCVIIDERRGVISVSSFEETRNSMIAEASKRGSRSLVAWKTDIAHNLVKLCVDRTVPWRELATVAWSISCWMGLHECYVPIYDDLDIDNRNRRTQKFSDTTVGLAQACYDGHWDQRVILADALEELEDVPPDWLEHLRERDKHWQGCWVVDNVLGGRT